MGQDDKPFNLFEYANDHFRNIVGREMMIYSAQVFVESTIPYNPEEKKIPDDRLGRIQNLLWRADLNKFRFGQMHKVLAEQVFKDGDMVDFLYSLAAQFRAVITKGTYEALLTEHLTGMFTRLSFGKNSPADLALRLGPQPMLDSFDRPENQQSEAFFANDWLVMLLLLRINLDLIFQLYADQQKAKQAAVAAQAKPAR